MKRSIRNIFLAAVVSIFCVSTVSAEENKMNDSIRIQNVMAKIRRGENVTVVALGGSITTGFSSNPINTNSWAARTSSYLKKIAQENNSNLTFYNRGVSGTDSAFAIARLQDHILSLNPDLVLLEFAMNDQWLAQKVRMRTYEGILRHLMNNKETAILALFVNERKVPYRSNQAEQQKLCEYYKVPYVSWKDCLFEENPAASFESYFDGTETVHPNNAGHEKISEFMIAKLDEIWKSLPQDKEIPSVEKNLPDAKNPDWFENTVYYHMENIKPSLNSGWTNGSPVHPEWVKHGNVRKGWETSTAGAEISFEVEGKSIGITYCESDQFQDAVAWITDEDGLAFPKVPLACYVSYRNGYYGWAYKELLSLRKSGKYTVHIQCPADSGKAGKKCNITGILVSK